MKTDHLQVVTELIHQVRFNLRIDRLESWSEKLEGISLLDLHILKLAAEHPGIVLKEIRQELTIPHSTLTSAIDRLEGRDLLVRVISHRDRRSFELKITEKGWRIREEHDQVDRMVAETVLNALNEEHEREVLIDLLTKINQRLGYVSAEELVTE